MQLAEPQRLVKTSHGSFPIQQQFPSQWVLGYLDGRSARKHDRKPETSGSRPYVLGFYCGFRAE